MRYIGGQTVEKSLILTVFHSFVVYLGTSQELQLLCALYTDCKILNELEMNLKKAQRHVRHLLCRYLFKKLKKKAINNLRKAVVTPTKILIWHIWDKLRSTCIHVNWEWNWTLLENKEILVISFIFLNVVWFCWSY